MDLEKRTAALHLGSVLTDEERRLLLCDATCEVWLEKHGQPIRGRAQHPHHQPPAAIALWNTATAAAGSPGAGRPAACTRITSFMCAVRRVFSDRR